MTKVPDVNALEKDVFKCTISNSTRRNLEFLMEKVSRLDIPLADTVAMEKQNRMKTHLEGLLEKIEIKDNYKLNWSFNWTGLTIGLIAAGVVFLLFMVLR